MFFATGWNCPQCATQDIQADVCPNCGWSRNGVTGQVDSLLQAPVARGFHPAQEDEVFILDKANTKLVMGESRSIGARFFWYFLLAAIATACFVPTVVAYEVNEWNTFTMINQSGITVQATVINHRRSTGKSTSYYLTYQFQARERAYSREQAVNSDIYVRYPINSLITVKYLRDDPTASLLAGDAEYNSNMIWEIAGVAILCILFLAVSLSTAIKSSRYRRLSREGKLIAGEVVFCIGSRVRKKGWVVTLRY